MLTSEIGDLLTLLAVAIFADERVFAQEIETFMHEAQSLQVAREIEPRLTEARLLSWFEMNRKDLKERIAKPGYEAWLKTLLGKLKHLHNKTLILDAMYKISIADSELHQSESDLINFSARCWNIKYYPPTLTA